ncbi:MAG: flavin reductase family protein [Dehalococcoidales bacterium]
MAKVRMGAQPLVYPMPVFLVGAMVRGEPNFLTAAWGGIANGEPPMVSVAIGHDRYSHDGIRDKAAFSLNIPPASLARELDYCGLFSGSSVDKVTNCGFSLFYGTLDNVPLISQCPVNLECRVVHSLDLGSHMLFVARIEEVYVSEEYLTDGEPDVEKIAPITYITSPASQYRKLGEVIDKAFSCGKEISGGG